MFDKGLCRDDEASRLCSVRLHPINTTLQIEIWSYEAEQRCVERLRDCASIRTATECFIALHQAKTNDLLDLPVHRHLKPYLRRSFS